ncbi:MAG: hypothetical protein ABJC51_08360 [Acidobacteriota bacterium]
MRYVVLGFCVFAAACAGEGASAPTSPSSAAAAAADLQGLPGSSSPSSATSAAQPPFNLEAILRGDGFGLVKFRQQKDPTQNIINLDVWVRDLLPNTSYSLQRAVDTTLDGVCTGTNWLTLGQGLTPQSINTDATGTGRAVLQRNLSSIAAGTAFDIHFRVIQTGTTNVALQSDCYRFVVRD